MVLPGPHRVGNPPTYTTQLMKSSVTRHPQMRRPLKRMMARRFVVVLRILAFYRSHMLLA